MVVPPFGVKALYEYASNVDDDLNFPIHQLITVTEEEDADWYYGEYEDSAGKKHEGLFPKNFVKPFEPETPPRPSRQSRTKKEPEPLTSANETDDARDAEHISSPTDQATTLPSSGGPEEVEELHNQPQQELEQHVQPPTFPPPKESSASRLPASTSSKPVPPTSSKPVPPPAPEKPSSGSFRDRINAFNKPTAPPVAPMKPSGLGGVGGSGFIKKPFVAPPPSKNAYVPPPREPGPQKLYRREEDPGPTAQTSHNLESEYRDIPNTEALSIDDSDDQPKPTSLKDRIALLQKQQMEQAARHAEAGQKKERPKRPSKKQSGSENTRAEDDQLQGGGVDLLDDSEPAGKRILEQPSVRTRGTQRMSLVGSPTTATSPRELLSDADDADQAGTGDTEEGEEIAVGLDDSNDNSIVKTSFLDLRPSQAPVRVASVDDDKKQTDGGDSAEEDDDGDDDGSDIDPEVKRRMEIRERMAKMSGGMGMAGMLGGVPTRGSAKHSTSSIERHASGNSASGLLESSASRAPPVPVMNMDGFPKAQTSEGVDSAPEISSEEMIPSQSIIQGQEPTAKLHMEDLPAESLRPARRSTERPAPPLTSEDHPASSLLDQTRGAPPPVPNERPVPPAPLASRPLPPPPSNQPLSPSEGSDSDGDVSFHTRTQSFRVVSESENSRPLSQDHPTSSTAANTPPSLPSRPQVQSRSSNFSVHNPSVMTADGSALSPVEAPRRSSRVPPIPGSISAMPPAPHSRAPPPPPPPSDHIPSKPPVGSSKMSSDLQKPAGSDSDEEITEYDGDYETDVASSTIFRDALKSHARVPSPEDDSMIEETSIHHSGLPSSGLSQTSAPRAVPPPPPTQPPRHNRQSSDMPRAAPPPLPPQDQPHERQDDDYDPYRYTGPPPRGVATPHGDSYVIPSTPRVEEAETLNPDPSPPLATPSTMQPSQYMSSPSLSGPGRSGTRQSTDVQRTNTVVRRSTEVPRSSGEHGFMASDVDLGHESLWWTQSNATPPVFQNRRDILVEIEETSTTKRGGNHAVTRDVYILFMDYSQTVVTAQFEARDPANAAIDQRHEPPPRPLRQDQLEENHTKFGIFIAESANSKKETVLGDGTPHSLPLDIISSLPNALKPVGLRAYGAIVYANLANASVQQYDEIRPGDIVTFRNAKFQGHRGPMHTKYSVEVGKPDHVGVVIDWDGTKKKVRAWEQGRESKKVKAESFKFGDMRSGEVKVWRVMSRSWVGWESQS